MLDAQRVCAKLGIPFHEANFVKEYWTYVFEQMLGWRRVSRMIRMVVSFLSPYFFNSTVLRQYAAAYTAGLTPNPDVMCNRYVKFGFFLEFATKKFAPDFVATGHYARMLYPPPTSSAPPSSSPTSTPSFSSSSLSPNARSPGAAAGGSYSRLVTAVDPVKDQTYFLCNVRFGRLDRVLFPVGHLRKPQVRRIAAEAGLDNVADKRDSVGICFVGRKKRFQSFLEGYILLDPHQQQQRQQQLFGSSGGGVMDDRSSTGLSDMSSSSFLLPRTTRHQVSSQCEQRSSSSSSSRNVPPPQKMSESTRRRLQREADLRARAEREEKARLAALERSRYVPLVHVDTGEELGRDKHALMLTQGQRAPLSGRAEVWTERDGWGGRRKTHERRRARAYGTRSHTLTLDACRPNKVPHTVLSAVGLSLARSFSCCGVPLLLLFV
jgi:tRNA U34 2-thiouridine synthase MnmA/TrmU